MSSIQKAKQMAKSLRASLEKRNQEVSHSVALELVAQQLGYKDWNVASAMLPDENPQPAVTFDKAIPYWEYLTKPRSASFILIFWASASSLSTDSKRIYRCI
ncbi:hypothetical protein SRABI111_00698 [Pseudomonas carnis]|nr:hypothetical protein SRABI08_00455 [Pseudomonas carnis]CAH0150676.1 hypothetical protein SRABI111_00698 [Pseudomonas carnis]CAH0210371.1 hypothetical protein SRABI64_01964 [Pseudomonas carnis]CAH0223592.1 hypothetical protein SRABI110_02546 [Pseudomonas carnis]